jgi:hypothetical protein
MLLFFAHGKKQKRAHACVRSRRRRRGCEPEPLPLPPGPSRCAAAWTGCQQLARHVVKVAAWLLPLPRRCRVGRDWPAIRGRWRRGFQGGRRWRAWIQRGHGRIQCLYGGGTCFLGGARCGGPRTVAGVWLAAAVATVGGAMAAGVVLLEAVAAGAMARVVASRAWAATGEGSPARCRGRPCSGGDDMASWAMVVRRWCQRTSACGSRNEGGDGGAPCPFTSTVVWVLCRFGGGAEWLVLSARRPSSGMSWRCRGDMLWYTVPLSGRGDAEVARSLCTTVCLSVSERCGVARAKACTGTHVVDSAGGVLGESLTCWGIIMGHCVLMHGASGWEPGPRLDERRRHH